ncbi:hypothetical protein ACQY0O_000626 [Thecaphora frezii]
MAALKLLAVASALAVAPLAASASANHRHMDLAVRQQQDPNTPLYLNSPYCNYYQCSVIWGAGDKAVVNWLNAPAGDVQVDLMTDASSKLAYKIATAPAVSDSCDAGNGYGVAVKGTTCGGFVFTVPSSWANGNYTMRASSVQKPSIDSYTDVILIMNNGTVKDTPFAVVSGSIESGASSTAASSSTSAAHTSTASKTASAQPTSSTKPSSSSQTSAPASNTTAASNSGAHISSPVALGSLAAAALGLAMLI